MKRALSLQKEYSQIGTIEDLTSVFEAIASLHITQIKDKVVSSTAFFNELWQIYRQLRVTEDERVLVRQQNAAASDRPLILVVTGEGGLNGDIDERIVATVPLADMQKADVIAVGAHGATLLKQKGITPTKTVAMPDMEAGADLTPLAKLLSGYKVATVYYETYISLARQEVAKLDLFSAVTALGEDAKDTNAEVISSQDYIFEPSVTDITAYMESVMLEIALGQVLLESKLAQYASRFNAMTAAKNKAKDLRTDLQLDLNRARRGEGDERIREVITARKALAQ